MYINMIEELFGSICGPWAPLLHLLSRREGVGCLPPPFLEKGWIAHPPFLQANHPFGEKGGREEGPLTSTMEKEESFLL